MKIFAVVASIATVTSAASNLLNQKAWSPATTLINNADPPLIAKLTGNTAISDNQSLYSVIIDVLFYRGDTTNYDIKLDLAAEELNKFEVNVKDDKLTFTAPHHSKQRKQEYSIGDDCRLTAINNRIFTHSFHLDIEETCVTK